MIPVATTAQMRECDRITIEEVGIGGLVLMESASRGVAVTAVEMLSGEPVDERVVIFCGRGNNGGDGLAVARYLHNWGAKVQVKLLCKSSDLKGDAAHQHGLFRGIGGKVKECPDGTGLGPVKEDVDLVIDALLGTGFRGEVRGHYAGAVVSINKYACPTLSVDIPSGVNGDTGSVKGVAVQAQATVTFALRKPGLLLSPGCDHTGEISVIDIGIPESVVESQNLDIFLVDDSDMQQALPQRSPSAHKGDVGHVYIIAGSPGLTGAAALSTEAAMRTGAGLALAGVPQSLNAIIEGKLTEAMSQPLADNVDGCLTSAGLESIRQKLVWAHAVVFGPGIGRHADTAILMRDLLPIVDTPFVIDADGLNLLADNPDLIKKLPSQTILTPHPGEFARLCGKTTAEIADDRIALARQFASAWDVVLHLKGSPSLTALSDGRLFINSTGNAGMATGGSGDVLTGIIASLAAQGLPPDQACIIGACLHGQAGDRAAETLGQAAVMAGDIISQLAAILKGYH